MGIENSGAGDTAGAFGGGGESSASSSAMDDLLSVTRDLRDNLSRLVGASKSLAGEKLHGLRDGTSDLLGRGRDRVTHLAENAGGYVREEPLKALIVAAGAGLLIGYLLKRR